MVYEDRKKEDRKEGGGRKSTLASFIDNYNHSDIYLVQDIVKENPLAGLNELLINVINCITCYKLFFYRTYCKL